MRFLSFLVAATAVALPVSASETKSYSVSRSVTIDASAEEVWNVMGDFCDLDDWHPAFVGCQLKAIDGGLHRILTMDGGGAFVEKLVASEPGLSYTYSIVEGPLPLERYTGTMSITPGQPVEVTWSSRFKSPDPEMEGAVIGVYESGLEALAAQF